VARVRDFVGPLAQFDLGRLMTQDMAGRSGVIRIGVIRYHRVDDYFRVFLGAETRIISTMICRNPIHG
jgi:hypothetical protein